MIKIYIEKIDKLIVLEKPITNIIVENAALYRNLYFNYESDLIISDNNEIIPFKKIEIINNPFELNINSKKNLNILYKILEMNKNDDDKVTFNNILNEIINLIEKLSNQINLKLEYEFELTLIDLFSFVKLKIYNDSDLNYLDFLINYFRAICELTDCRLIISFGLVNILNDDELDKVLEELKFLDLKIFDITNSKLVSESTELIIDEDYCIL